MKSYLNNNGTLNYYSDVVDRMFDFLKKEYENNNVPEAVWTELSDIKAEALDDIVEMISQSYESHFAKDEMQSMLNFYKTESGLKILSKSELTPEDVEHRDVFYASALGQKIATSTESLNNILQKMTQEWSAQLFRDVQEKLKEKGFVKG